VEHQSASEAHELPVPTSPEPSRTRTKGFRFEGHKQRFEELQQLHEEVAKQRRGGQGHSTTTMSTKNM